MNKAHADILERMKEQKARGGIELDKLPIGTIIEAHTRNTLYKITALGKGDFEVEGGKYCPLPTVTRINGSTWGGTMIQVGWLGIDMHIEFFHFTTTAIKSLKVIAPDGSWEYDL